MVEPVFLEEFLLLLIGLLKLGELVNFVAGVVSQFERNVSSSPQPGSLDLEVGLLSVDSVDGEGELLEVGVGSLEESIHGVV